MKLLSVDIGGTFIKYAHMLSDMSILHSGKVPTPQTSREELVDCIAELFRQYEGAEGICIAMPGIIDAESGTCLVGGALRYNEGFALGKALWERCNVPVHVENDAKCGAMAEAAAGSLKDVPNGIVLLFGTMIGCGIIIDHKLYKGKHFAAGEVSYIIPRPDNRVDYPNVWGNSGGTPRLCKLFAEKKGLEKCSGEEVFDAVESGCQAGISSLKEYCHELAVQIFNLQTVIDPERIAIGGGISARGIFIEYLKRSLEELYEQCPYPIPRAEIVPCTFLKDANLIGALQCFLENKKSTI